MAHFRSLVSSRRFYAGECSTQFSATSDVYFRNITLFHRGETIAIFSHISVTFVLIQYGTVDAYWIRKKLCTS